MKPVSSPLITRVDHIGVIVNDLAEARRWLSEVFGLPLRRCVELSEGRIRGEFYACGDMDIELIEIRDPETRRQRLQEGKQACIDHIAVEVDDLGIALARLDSAGVRITEPRPRRMGDTLNARTVKETSGGISYQLVERMPDLSTNGPSE